MTVKELIKCLQQVEDDTEEVVLKLDGNIYRYSECHGTMFGRIATIYHHYNLLNGRKTIVLFG
jgi:hypothetical protein